MVKVICKALASLLNRRLTSAITFHNVRHKFQAVCEKETSVLESNMIQQLKDMKEVVLFEFFL